MKNQSAVDFVGSSRPRTRCLIGTPIAGRENRQALNVDLMRLNPDASMNLKPGLGGHRGLGRVETIMVALEVHAQWALGSNPPWEMICLSVE